ncbi:MAG: HAD hydrolase-like protein [Elusimicrobiales bacterium]|nr:HAD hydrolase-like protein [Elusimicrobiales bacterium]
MEKRQNIKIVLFDIDGTLIKAGGAGMRALNNAIVELGGPKNICNYFELQGVTDKVNFKNAFYFAFRRKPNRVEFKNLSDLYLKHLPKEVENSISNGKYVKINGIDYFLKYLSEQPNVFIGLGTGNLREGAYIKLAPSKLSHYFLFGGFGKDYEKREDMLLAAVKSASKITKTNINPNQVYVIGDTEKDIVAAKNCGFHSACVLDGFGDINKIIKSGPELIEKDFSNLKIWLIWLGLKKDPKGIKRGTYICPDTPVEHAYFGITGKSLFLDDEEFKKSIYELRKKKGYTV